MKKPVCLILDEIDGALGGGPDMSKGLGLVAYVLKKCIAEMDQVKKTTKPDEDIDMEEEGEENPEAGENSKPKAKAKGESRRFTFPALTRPIILVCNDGYAKPLFPLKDIVLKLRVPSAHLDRVNDRLVEILRKEEIRDFSNAVRKMIVEQSAGDARSAITRVQMIACNRDVGAQNDSNA